MFDETESICFESLLFFTQFVFHATNSAQLNTHSGDHMFEVNIILQIFFSSSEYRFSIFFSIKMCVWCATVAMLVEVTVTMSQSLDTCDEFPSNAIWFKLCSFFHVSFWLGLTWVVLFVGVSHECVVSCVEFHGIRFMLEEKRRLTGPRGTRRFEIAYINAASRPQMRAMKLHYTHTHSVRETANVDQ